MFILHHKAEENRLLDITSRILNIWAYSGFTFIQSQSAIKIRVKRTWKATLHHRFLGQLIYTVKVRNLLHCSRVRKNENILDSKIRGTQQVLISSRSFSLAFWALQTTFGPTWCRLNLWFSRSPWWPPPPWRPPPPWCCRPHCCCRVPWCCRPSWYWPPLYITPSTKHLLIKIRRGKMHLVSWK